MSWVKKASNAVLALGLAGCSVTLRCEEGGNTKWDPPIVGNKQCIQQKSSDGKFLNHGQFHQWYPSGKLALEGMFDMGKKDGVWVQLDEKGRTLQRREYEHGMEKKRETFRFED